MPDCYGTELGLLRVEQGSVGDSANRDGDLPVPEHFRIAPLEITPVWVAEAGCSRDRRRNAPGNLHLASGQRYHKHVIAESHPPVLSTVSKQFHGCISAILSSFSDAFRTATG
jgi:hypothetical protein